MAKVVQKNAKLAKQQDVKRNHEAEFKDAREKYLETLKDDDTFQKYVVIPLSQDITNLADIRNMPPAGTASEYGNLTYHIRLALNVLERFEQQFKK